MPAQGPEIAVKISAKADQFSAAVAQIKKELAGLPQIADQATKKLGSPSGGGFSIGRIGRQIQTEIGSAYSGASRLAARGVGAISSATRGIPGFGALAGAASIAGIGEMVSHFASAGIELTNTARLAGTSAEGLNSLRGAARLMGLQAGDADATMLGLNRTLQDATYGRNATAAATFQQLGISFGDMAHGARTAGEVLPQVVDKITELAKTNPRRAVHLMDLVGIPASALPLLMRGREALDEQRRAVDRLYGDFDNFEKASSRFTAAQASMGMSTEKLGMSIMTALEPALSPMLTQLSHFVDTHNQDISETFKHIGTALEGVHWDQVGQGIEHVGDVIGRVSSRMVDFGTRIDHVVSSVRSFMDIIQAPGNAFRGSDQGPEMDLPIGSPGWRTFMKYAPRPSGPMGGFENGVPPAPPRVSTFDTNLDPRARGLLDTIAGTESGGRYDVTYGGRLPNYDNVPAPEHVIQRGPHKGELTSAFGRYQFENGTWDQAAAALGLTDKTPRSQDRAAWWLAQREYRQRTHRDLQTDLSSSDPTIRDGIGRALRVQWTSLPGGIEAGTNDNRFGRQLDANIGREERAGLIPGSAPGAPPRLPALMTPGPSASNDSKPGSTHKITIDLNGAPHGATVRLNSQGEGAEIAGIRVRRAMPDAGGGNMGPGNPFGGQ